jgi:selenocysteine-specific translation elongation factor
MTIYELANGAKAQRVSYPEGFRALREEFPPEESEILAAEHGQLVIAINHVRGRFAVSRVGCCVLGDALQDLTPEQLQRLQKATVC